MRGYFFVNYLVSTDRSDFESDEKENGNKAEIFLPKKIFTKFNLDYTLATIDINLDEILMANTEKANDLIQQIVPLLSGRNISCVCGCHTALDAAIITAPEFRDPKLVKKLSAIAGRLL